MTRKKKRSAIVARNKQDDARKHRAARIEWHNGPETALYVDARMAGFPTEWIERYKLQHPRERWAKRTLLARWVKRFEEAQPKLPRDMHMPEDWMDWRWFEGCEGWAFQSYHQWASTVRWSTVPAPHPIGGTLTYASGKFTVKP